MITSQLLGAGTSRIRLILAQVGLSDRLLWAMACVKGDVETYVRPNDLPSVPRPDRNLFVSFSRDEGKTALLSHAWSKASQFVWLGVASTVARSRRQAM